MRLFGNKGHFELTDAERDAISQDDCAGPDKSFPCDTQKHFDAAVKLIGLESEADQVKLKAKAKSIAKRLGWTLPDTWKSNKAEMESRESCICEIAEFGDVDGDYVPWGPSVIFECGVYPHQGVDADEDYIERAVRNSSEAPFKNAHLHDKQSIFSNLDLGGAARVWKEGRRVFGEGIMHKAVRAVGKSVSVSVEIENPQTNPRISEIALLNYPQVKSAVAVAAFGAASDEPVSFAGARHSKADLTHVQAIHDHAASLGALCEPEQEPGSTESDAKFGGRHNAADRDSIQAMHDLSVEQGATCTSKGAEMGATVRETAPVQSGKELKAMNSKTLKERFAAFKAKHPDLLKDPDALVAAFEKSVDEEDAAPVVAAVDPAKNAQFENYDRHMKAMENQMLRSKAAEFATEVISKLRRAQPAERGALEHDYITYATIDGGARIASYET